MLKTYICDDNNSHRTHFEKQIENYNFINGTDFHVVMSTANPHEVVEQIKKVPEIALYFIDIDLQTDIDGLELARQIREYDSWGFIIFITTHDEVMPLTFKNKVSALDFIEKESALLGEPVIADCLATVWKKMGQFTPGINETLTLKVQDKHFSIKLSDIYRIESTGEHRKVTVIEQNGYLHISALLKEVYDSLTEDFVYTGRNCIINKNHVVSYDSKNRLLHFDNNTTCSVSTRTARSFRL